MHISRKKILEIFPDSPEPKIESDYIDYENRSTIGPENGCLIIHGGGELNRSILNQFVDFAGGNDAHIVAIPTALRNNQLNLQEYAKRLRQMFGVSHVDVLHTRDRVQADTETFVESLKKATGVWIDGGRQWRLVDAYLQTRVEREIKAMLGRGGVVFGSSAGATIQGSFLVRGVPGTEHNPDGCNTIVISPNYISGFGLIKDVAIDQNVLAPDRNREGDMVQVIEFNKNILGLGIDESASIIVHRDKFIVNEGICIITDGNTHNGNPHYRIKTGQIFDLKTRMPVQ